jgi:hypothetical protein
MSESAGVTSIESLQDLRNALCSFRKEAGDALCAVELEVRRAFDWVEDQGKLWQKEVRVREDEVFQAKQDLSRRKGSRMFGHPPDCTDQEKALHEAEERLWEAQEKTENCRRWVPLLQDAVREYEGPARQVSGLLDVDFARALALLDRKLATLESYAALGPVSGSSGAATGSTDADPLRAAVTAASPATPPQTVTGPAQTAPAPGPGEKDA